MTEYRSTVLPEPAQLEAVAALYETISAGTAAPRSHVQIPPAAWKILTAIRKLAAAGEPDGYLSSERRLKAARDLAQLADNFTYLVNDLIGDEQSPLDMAHDGRDLLAEYADGCELADVTLRASIHESLRAA